RTAAAGAYGLDEGKEIRPGAGKRAQRGDPGVWAAVQGDRRTGARNGFLEEAFYEAAGHSRTESADFDCSVELLHAGNPYASGCHFRAQQGRDKLRACGLARDHWLDG